MRKLEAIVFCLSMRRQMRRMNVKARGITVFFVLSNPSIVVSDAILDCPFQRVSRITVMGVVADEI